MQRILYILAFIIAAPLSLIAQDSRTTPSKKCPKIAMECPMDGPPNDADIKFTVHVSGADPEVKLLFNWTVLEGIIKSGQGSPTITVDGFGDSIHALVEIQGFPSNCSVNKTACSLFWRPQPTSQLFDKYGDIDEEDEMARLDNFGIELREKPWAMAYLIAYAGRRAFVDETNARLERAKDYLIKSRGVSGDRIVTMDGGYRDEVNVELFLVPIGALPPVASPTVEPGDVQIIPKVSAKPKRRAQP